MRGTSVSWATRSMIGSRAGDVPRPTGAAAEAIIAANWPSVSESAIEEIATEHAGLANQLNELGQVTSSDRTTQSELLRGAAGDAHYNYLTKMMGHDFDAADHFSSKVTTATGFAAVARGVKLRLSQIMDTAGPEYDEAVSSGNPAAIAAVLTKYQPEVQAVMMDAWTELKLTPAPTAPPGDPDAAPYDHGTAKDERRTAAEDPNATTPGSGDNSDVEAVDETRQAANPSLDDHAGNPDSAPRPFDENRQLPTDPIIEQVPTETPLPQQPQAPFQMPANPMGSGGGGGSGLGSGGGSGVSSASGLGSLAKPMSPGSVPTTPASSSAASPSSLAGNPLTQATSQFQQGLSSGMGSSGAVPPASFAPPPPPVESFSPQQPAVAAAPPAATTQAAGPASTSAFGPASGATAPPAHGGVAGGPVGGGAMMPPPMAGAAPVTPYSAPGAGTATPTTPASAPAAPPAHSAASAPSAGPTPVITGATGAVTGASVSSVDTNPDLVAAQHILAGLVKACQARPIFWAVSVLRTPVGPQTVVAGSVGGGIYLPPEVFLPSTVRLAVLDPALPFGWAHHWMGWQSPSSILAEHVDQLQHVVSGVTMSAMVTCELWPRRPDCGGDFLAIRHDELLGSNASPLTGCHRLTATDPVLASRLAALDRGGDVSKWVASELTGAVVRTATEPDATGSPLAVAADAAILGLVSAGSAGEKEWQEYQEDVDRRGDGAVLMPEIHAPRDADDSPSTRNARLWYQHYYAMGRIAEMVKCWAAQPISVAEVAYCAVAAGFGGTVAAVVAELEQRLAELPVETHAR